MKQKPKPVPVVSAILMRWNNEEPQVFLQTRWKPTASPAYSGMIEIPAGGVESYENVYDALRREVKEETGLAVVRVIGDYRSGIVRPTKHDKAFVFRPFICQQMLQTKDGLPWIGFVFLCEVRGKVRINEDEAKDPKWVSVRELRRIVENAPDSIFPLQLPALEYFVEHFDKKMAA